MEHGSPIEEETLPFYKPEQFYPIRIGEVLDSRYRVVGKLGYGSYSTVWLCREIKNHRHVAVKVLTRISRSDHAMNGEMEIYSHLSKVHSSHIGGAYIRGLHDAFEIHVPEWVHQCFVHPPMQIAIHELLVQAKCHKLSEDLLKQTLICLFQALDFLHSIAGVVHSDIKASNIILNINDDSILTDFEEAERQYPSPRKSVDTNRTIYCSREFRLPEPDLWGQPVLCDLGQARIGEFHRGNIQPNIYKAPEVLFDMEWSFSVDIWNVGVMIWDMFEGRYLFNALDEDRQYSPSHHVAEMVAYLGLPPIHFLERSEETQNVFDRNGKWLGAGGVSIPDISLESSEKNLGDENKILFLKFIRSMLQWQPEKRKTARELLEDPWLNDSF